MSPSRAVPTSRRESSSGDENFQGYGAVLTDAQGRYAFRTIKPVPYPGRTPHIHFTVLEGGKRRITSQMFNIVLA